MPLRLSTGLRDKLIGAKANLVTNGSFDTNTTGWTASGATLSAGAGGASSTTGLEIANSGASAGSAYVDLTTRVGRVYLAKVKFKKGTAVGGSIDIGTTAAPKSIYDGATETDAVLTQKQVAFVASATTTRFTLNNDSAVTGETVLFDDVVIEEILDGFTEIMRGCKINVYTGAQPTTANDVATGTLLFTVTKGGDGVTGLEWNPASAGAASKPSGDSWAGTAVAAGTAGWFRCYEEGDDPATASTTNARFDGAVATTGAQINMTSTTIALSAVQTVSSFTYTQPAA
jgi:hypothetical protein